MKKNILVCCVLAIIVSCGGGDGTPAPKDRMNGSWSYVLVMGGSFITARGTATFNGYGAASYTEDEKSGGDLQDPGTFNYTIDNNNRIVFEQWDGNLSSDGNFFVATDTNDTVADPGVMFMIAVRQPTGADNSSLAGTFFSGVFMNTADGTSSSTVVNEATMNGASPGIITVDEIIMPNPDPAPGITKGYEVAADGLTTIYNAPLPVGTPTGEVGIVSIDGNLFINADATGVTNPLLSMSIKGSSGKTNADLTGTYVLHRFMDDNIGAGNFITTRSEVTFNGDNVVGVGTGTYTETAKSNYDPDTNPLDPTQPFDYKVDVELDGNPATFLIIDPTDGDHIYGVMSPDASVLGVVNVNNGGGDTTVFLGVAVKK